MKHFSFLFFLFFSLTSGCFLPLWADDEEKKPEETHQKDESSENKDHENKDHENKDDEKKGDPKEKKKEPPKKVSYEDLVKSLSCGQKIFFHCRPEKKVTKRSGNQKCPVTLINERKIIKKR